MKIVTFRKPGDPSPDEGLYRIGALVAEGEIANLTPLVSDGPITSSGILNCLDLDSGFLDRAREEVGNSPSDTINLADVELCSPVPRPGKIICIGLNYRDHAEESGMAIPTAPVIFSKYSRTGAGTAAKARSRWVSTTRQRPPSCMMSNSISGAVRQPPLDVVIEPAVAGLRLGLGGHEARSRRPRRGQHRLRHLGQGHVDLAGCRHPVRRARCRGLSGYPLARSRSPPVARTQPVPAASAAVIIDPHIVLLPVARDCI